MSPTTRLQMNFQFQKTQKFPSSSNLHSQKFFDIIFLEKKPRKEMIYIQLDTHLKTSEERLEYINNLLQSKTSFTENELEWMATYLTYPLEKEERRQRRIMTDNRRVTIEAHESSYEGLSTKFEAGDDALEAISQSRPVLPTRITPRKRPITTRDLDTIPGLRSVRESAA